MVDQCAKGGYRKRMSIGTTLFTLFRGRLIGRDAQGNCYYTEKRARTGMRQRRWVMYAGQVEASRVPPEWHSWLHYTTEAPISDAGRKSWQKPHQANQTGTTAAFRPKVDSVVGDYQAWSPDNQHPGS